MLNALIAVLIILFILLFCYYTGVIINFYSGDYWRARSEFLQDLKPFNLWITAAKEKWESTLETEL
jgi:hypothetical protein